MFDVNARKCNYKDKVDCGGRAIDLPSENKNYTGFFGGVFGFFFFFFFFGGGVISLKQSKQRNKPKFTSL